MVRIPGVSDGNIATVVELLVHAGIGIHEVRREDQSLEDVFMNLTEGGGL